MLYGFSERFQRNFQKLQNIEDFFVTNVIRQFSGQKEIQLNLILRNLEILRIIILDQNRKSKKFL